MLHVRACVYLRPALAPPLPHPALLCPPLPPSACRLPVPPLPSLLSCQDAEVEEAGCCDGGDFLLRLREQSREDEWLDACYAR